MTGLIQEGGGDDSHLASTLKVKNKQTTLFRPNIFVETQVKKDTNKLVSDFREQFEDDNIQEL